MRLVLALILLPAYAMADPVTFRFHPECDPQNVITLDPAYIYEAYDSRTDDGVFILLSYGREHKVCGTQNWVRNQIPHLADLVEE